LSDDIIGRRIRAYRKLKGYTQQGLAEALGVSVAVIGSVERGTRMPKKQLLQDIADVLNIEVEELLPSDRDLDDG
jgi:transcriptional regulator with XRE-family HTH domain